MFFRTLRQHKPNILPRLKGKIFRPIKMDSNNIRRDFLITKYLRRISRFMLNFWQSAKINFFRSGFTLSLSLSLSRARELRPASGLLNFSNSIFFIMSYLYYFNIFLKSRQKKQEPARD